MDDEEENVFAGMVEVAQALVQSERVEAEQLLDPEVPQFPELDDSKVLGCPRCYLSPTGCAICRKPNYKMRVTREQALEKIREQLAAKAERRAQAKAKATAKAKAKGKPPVKKIPKASGPGKSRGRTRKA